MRSSDLIPGDRKWKLSTSLFKHELSYQKRKNIILSFNAGSVFFEGHFRELFTSCPQKCINYAKNCRKIAKNLQKLTKACLVSFGHVKFRSFPAFFIPIKFLSFLAFFFRSNSAHSLHFLFRSNSAHFLHFFFIDSAHSGQIPLIPVISCIFLSGIWADSSTWAGILF